MIARSVLCCCRLSGTIAAAGPAASAPPQVQSRSPCVSSPSPPSVRRASGPVSLERPRSTKPCPQPARLPRFLRAPSFLLRSPPVMRATTTNGVTCMRHHLALLLPDRSCSPPCNRAFEFDKADEQLRPRRLPDVGHAAMRERLRGRPGGFLFGGGGEQHLRLHGRCRDRAKQRRPVGARPSCRRNGMPPG